MAAVDRGEKYLRITDLHAFYGESHILHGMDFRVDRGECVNVGVVVHSQSAGVLRCGFHLDEPRITALAEYPLRPEFRHGPSGMLSGSREFWERHAAHGIEPGLELRDRERAILEHDPSLRPLRLAEPILRDLRN